MATGLNIVVSIAEQILQLFEQDECVASYPVSTAKNGLGEQFGSECTPRGKHIVRAKIGDGVDMGSVFIGRRLTGETYSAELSQLEPERDWILTRILWLSGTKSGKNRGGDVDTMRRYIYIHGAPDALINGTAASHGCIRMRNADVVDLFQRVPVQTPVTIVER
jgi:lipoprotein-anchoring transpeptidase ErfK/SrfK